MHNAQLICRPWYLVILCALSLLGCSDKTPQTWSGYVVGDYVYIASPLAGRLDKITVRPGQQVSRGDALFDLDAENENAAAQESAARLAIAQAQAANLDKGKRQDEIAVVQAQLNQAQANKTLAVQTFERQQKLFNQNFISKATLDDAITTLKQSEEKVAELIAALKVAQLPARIDERNASKANAKAANEVLRQSKWRTTQKHQFAPTDAVVSDVFFRQGEYIPAGQAVLSLLPPANIKARFYVSQATLPMIELGQKVSIECDGCGTPISAVISRIATQAEYTPPVIYSNTERAKLVFMVEAYPNANDAARLKTGQPVDVRIKQIKVKQ